MSEDASSDGLDGVAGSLADDTTERPAKRHRGKGRLPTSSTGCAAAFLIVSGLPVECDLIHDLWVLPRLVNTTLLRRYTETNSNQSEQKSQVNIVFCVRQVTTAHWYSNMSSKSMGSLCSPNIALRSTVICVVMR